MKRICKNMTVFMVLFSTLFLHPLSVNATQNTNYISDYQNVLEQTSKTAYLGKKMLQSNLEKSAKEINQEMNTLLPDMEFDTVKIEKGRRFIVVSDRILDSNAVSGIPVKFESVQNEYLAYDKRPSKIIFQGRIEKTGKPKMAGRNGTIKIKLEKITVDKITYPVSALISKIDNKNVHFNTLSAAPLYLANLADAATSGTINTQWKDPCTNHLCTTEKSNLTRPLIYLGAAALQAADLLLSPVSALFRSGKSVSIPERTYFEIKMDKDMYVLNI